MPLDDEMITTVNTDRSEMSPAMERRVDFGLALLLLFGSLLIYYPALNAGFVWDDDVHFTANDAVRRWWGIVDIWTSRTAVYYPLVLTTGWALHKIVGFNPFVFHAVTLLFHVASALMLVVILKRFGIKGAWIVGFLFAWHPLQVESVAWVTELKNTQSALFLFMSILALQKSGYFTSSTLAPGFPRRWYGVSIALFLLALLSKTSVVMAPIALAAFVWWRRGIRRWMDIDGLFPYFFLSVLAAGWTVWEQRFSSGAQGFEWAMSFVERLALSGQVFWFYLIKLIWPFPVMFLYPKWEVMTGGVAAFLPLALALGAGGVCWWKRTTWGFAPGLILLCYAALIFPVMGFFNVYFMRYAWVADHFVYLGSIAVFVGMGLLFAKISAWQRHAAFAMAVVILGVYVLSSHTHVRTFHNSETLWRHTIRSNPEAWMAYNNLGSILRAKGDRKAARELYEQALEINPRHYEALNNIGLLYLEDQRAADALNYFDQAIIHRPDLYLAWINRGIAMEKLNRMDDARDSYIRAADINPRIDAPLVNLGVLYERTGDVDAAVAIYRNLLSRKGLDDQSIGAFLFERAVHIKNSGNNDTALVMLDAAAGMIPALPDIYLLQGELQELDDAWDQAIKSYRRAISYRPDWGAALIRLARLLSAHPEKEKRIPKEAIFIMEGMLSVSDGKVIEIFEVYAMALASAGRFGEAIQAQRQAIQLAKDTATLDEKYERLQLYELGGSFTIPSSKTKTAQP